VIKAKFSIYEWQRATASGVFTETRHCQWRLCVNAQLPVARLPKNGFLITINTRAGIYVRGWYL
jgi:hypothetical protein